MAVPDQPAKRGRGRPKGPTPEYFRRQQEIVATATEIFRVKADVGATIQEVAEALGLQRASVYHYVESKAHLLSLICERVIDATILEAIDRAARIEDPTERLEAAIRYHVGAIAEHQHVFRVFFEERGSLGEKDKARMRDLEARYLATLAGTVAAAIDAGVLPRTDPRQAALALIGLGSWLYKWFDPERDDADAYATVCLALLLQGRRLPARRRARQRQTTVSLGRGIDIPVGTHLCGFYRGRREFEAIVTPFLREGLADGDKTICVVDSLRPKTVFGWVKTEVNNAASGQLTVLPADEAHLRGGHFHPDEMLAWWEETIGGAVGTDGFPRVRVVGDMSWALRGAPGTEHLFTYEGSVNGFVGKYPQVLFCLYDLDRVDGPTVVEAMKTHPKTIIDGALVDSPCYSEAGH